jgi:hypothetical protein
VIVLRPKPVNHLVGGLKTVPIDPRNAHHLAIRIQNLATTGMPVTSPLRENRRGRTPSQMTTIVTKARETM